MFENRVLRRVFGPKREEVTGEWRKLHNEELSDLYSCYYWVQNLLSSSLLSKKLKIKIYRTIL